MERSLGYREFIALISRAISISAMVLAPSCGDVELESFDMFFDLSLEVGTEVFFTQKINNFLAKLDTRRRHHESRNGAEKSKPN